MSESLEYLNQFWRLRKSPWFILNRTLQVQVYNNAIPNPWQSFLYKRSPLLLSQTQRTGHSGSPTTKLIILKFYVKTEIPFLLNPLRLPPQHTKNMTRTKKNAGLSVNRQSLVLTDFSSKVYNVFFYFFFPCILSILVVIKWKSALSMPDFRCIVAVFDCGYYPLSNATE